MSKPVQSDIICGIDFGMTCTGVAYSHGPQWPAPKTIQKWPGILGHETRNKVETSIAYHPQKDSPASWGFLCNPDDEHFEYNSLFKLYLDPSHKNTSLEPSSRREPPSHVDSRRWFKDYLRCLYDYLIKHFRNILPRFEHSSIDFVFSVPVTWRNNPTLITDIEGLIYVAGFGSRSQDYASVYLTEAEAAAIYASRGRISRDDTFIVCDAGGGTTDLNVLRVTNAAKSSLELQPLSWTEGASIGSTLIDFRIQSIIRSRLKAVRNFLQEDISEEITKMMAEKLEIFKCSFGNPDMEMPRLLLPIPSLKKEVNLSQQGIEDSKIVITRAELQLVFDDYVDQMCALIDSQLALTHQRHPMYSVDYLILSGGLGSSPYIHSCLKARYESNAMNRLNRDKPLEVLLSDEPQLAVCHGLVMARMRAKTTSNDIMTTRCCPVSFGILTREPYEPHKHQGEEMVEDPYDNRRWAEGQINWVIRQGQIVETDYGVNERYAMKLEMGREFEPWRTTIVMSSLPAGQLPRSMRYKGAAVVCAVEAVLDLRDMKRKNRHWYNFRKEYNQAEFLVRVVVGTGLRFEIWSLDGQIRSRSHEEIAVQWINPDSEVLETPHPRHKDPRLPQMPTEGVSELSGGRATYELPGTPLD